MIFEWDENKRLRNIAKHGIDFEEAVEIFDGRITVTRRSNFPGEIRFLTIGRRDIDTISVVWTQRGPARRIISVRRARKQERTVRYTSEVLSERRRRGETLSNWEKVLRSPRKSSKPRSTSRRRVRSTGTPSTPRSGPHEPRR